MFRYISVELMPAVKRHEGDVAFSVSRVFSCQEYPGIHRFKIKGIKGWGSASPVEFPFIGREGDIAQMRALRR